MKITLSIISVAILASIFTTPVKSNERLQNYSNEIEKLEKIEEELKCIKEELDIQRERKLLSYKDQLSMLKEQNKKLICEIKSKKVLIDSLQVKDTLK
jgi:hypothetical protein